MKQNVTINSPLPLVCLGRMIARHLLAQQLSCGTDPRQSDRESNAMLREHFVHHDSSIVLTEHQKSWCTFGILEGWQTVSLVPKPPSHTPTLPPNIFRNYRYKLPFPLSYFPITTFCHPPPPHIYYWKGRPSRQFIGKGGLVVSLAYIILESLSWYGSKDQ